jgi:hypothetical protein
MTVAQVSSRSCSTRSTILSAAKVMASSTLPDEHDPHDRRLLRRDGAVAQRLVEQHVARRARAGREHQ